MILKVYKVVSLYKPAGDNDDILRDVGHLLDGEVAHPPQGLLGWKDSIKLQMLCCSMDFK